MKQLRFTPSESADLHGVRSASYHDAKHMSAKVEELDDEKLLRWLNKYRHESPDWFSRRTDTRVRFRIYSQEAHRRGLEVEP